MPVQKLHIDTDGLNLDAKRLERIPEYIENKYLSNSMFSCAEVMCTRFGKLAFHSVQGYKDRDTKTPLTEDTIFRIYSMTKPVTSIAFMQLVEKGLVSLNDPVHKYIPSFRKLRVYVNGVKPHVTTEPVTSVMRIHHLLTHTSGLTYGFLNSTNVDAMYRKLRVENAPRSMNLDEWIEQLASLPLEFQPGDAYNYSVSTDVLGYLVQKISNTPLDQYLKENIFDPIGMKDTMFYIDEDDKERQSRLASCYEFSGSMPPTHIDKKSAFIGTREFLSGGGGLLGTASDYMKFAECLRSGGELNNARIIGSHTLRYMTENHLEDYGTVQEQAFNFFDIDEFRGIGFGLGFQVMIDPVENRNISSVGEYGWGGLASTTFWIDPELDLCCVFMTQLIPSRTTSIRRELTALVNSAITD